MFSLLRDDTTYHLHVAALPEQKVLQLPSIRPLLLYQKLTMARTSSTRTRVVPNTTLAMCSAIRSAYLHDFQQIKAGATVEFYDRWIYRVLPDIQNDFAMVISRTIIIIMENLGYERV